MINRYSTKGLPLLKPSRALKFKQRTRFSMIRIFMSLLFFAGVIFAFSMWSNSARAIETTKASAVVIEKTHASYASYTKSSRSPQDDPCLRLLQTAHLSPDAAKQESIEDTNRRAISADKKAASVALGLFLGARLALGPKEIISDDQRVQIGPQFQATNDNGNNYALNISAYRSCKNNHVLEARR